MVAGDDSPTETSPHGWICMGPCPPGPAALPSEGRWTPALHCYELGGSLPAGKHTMQSVKHRAHSCCGAHSYCGARMLAMGVCLKLSQLSFVGSPPADKQEYSIPFTSIPFRL